MTAHLSTLLVVLTGALLAGGLVLLLRALVPATPRLADALELLAVETGPTARVEPDPSAAPRGRGERLGAWLHRHSPQPVTARQLQLLDLRGQTLTAFFTEKLLMAVVGALLPLLVSACLMLLVDVSLAVPVLATLAGAVAGWFVPDLGLHRGERAARTAASEALFAYFDLVVLERLANRSATQALQAAAAMSSSPLFLRIQAALERARLEQRPPWPGLSRLAEQLDLPQLADLADVMSLDETGAPLAATLRARVRELRDAHRNDVTIAAQEVSERMSVVMVVPAMVFGLIFLVPPLLRLVGP
ncbi:hypothetical protein GC722_03045 [Auraticoccus sp. F435]|uniref:Type II secretion system protein GspF domain-containing protein n=1 Tax=Auraticoccus cholistanensis TaxID=2656650 RepID=A0A6A9V055_9ACTN|nr:hypothetical protein [Auraticoccus cholistanensis]MVA75009.1 hypothetical protein [Auraticoccus cholistanensis]